MASDLLCVGLNYLKTPIELREQIAFSYEQIHEVIQQDHIHEGAILSTCNRVEIYAHGHLHKASTALKALVPKQSELYYFQGHHALRQLMRVASSLDSMIVGEPQILGQVKSALHTAKECGIAGPSLTQAFSCAFLTAKRVRHETELGKNAVTVAYAAVQLAEKVFGTLENLHCVLVGQGEMGSLAAKHFKQKKALITLINRQDNLCRALIQADLVLTSTNSSHHLIQVSDFKKIMRKRRYKPIFIIDIAVPRNIDPSIAALDNVYLYNIDDLVQVVQDNLNERHIKAQLAEQIIREEIQAYQIRIQEKVLAPIIEELQIKSLSIAEEELGKLNKMTPQLQKLGKQLAAKIFHQSVLALKKAGKEFTEQSDAQSHFDVL